MPFSNSNLVTCVHLQQGAVRARYVSDIAKQTPNQMGCEFKRTLIVKISRTRVVCISQWAGSVASPTNETPFEKEW